MNYIKKILNFGFLDKLDRYLLINYTFIWNFRLHYILFHTFICILFLMFMPCLFPYIFVMNFFIYIYWVNRQKNYIFIKEYSLLKHNIGIEFLIYSLISIVFFLPVFLGDVECNGLFDKSDGRFVTIYIIILFISLQIIFGKYLGLKKYLFSLFYILLFQILIWKNIGGVNDILKTLQSILFFKISVFIYMIVIILIFIFLKKYRLILLPNILLNFLLLFFINRYFFDISLAIAIFSRILIQFLILFFISEYFLQLLAKPED